MSAMSNEDIIYSVLEKIKEIPRSAPPTASLIRDLAFESIDIVDLYFEIEQSSGVAVELNQLMGETSGKTFEDLTIQDLVNHLDRHRRLK